MPATYLLCASGTSRGGRSQRALVMLEASIEVPELLNVYFEFLPCERWHVLRWHLVDEHNTRLPH